MTLTKEQQRIVQVALKYLIANLDDVNESLDFDDFQPILEADAVETKLLFD